MPLPVTVSTGVLRGRFTYNDGSAAVGTVQARASVSYLVDEDGLTVLPLPPTSATLDSDGEFALTLIATDDTDLNPIDWTYEFSAHIEGMNQNWLPRFSFAVESDSDIDISTIVPIATSGGSVQIPVSPPPFASNAEVLAGIISNKAVSPSTLANARPIFTVDNLTGLRASLNIRDTWTLGHTASGDGGGGLWHFDVSDTTSPDNAGTCVIPASGILAAQGRWKRQIDGPVNIRWFGVLPGVTDCTAQLQAAVTYVCERAQIDSSTIGSGLFCPSGYYRFTFTEGLSGLATILVDADNINIFGEGASTIFTVRQTSAKVDYFFTFLQATRGNYGGIRNVRFDGNSDLNWCIYMDTWRGASFTDIIVHDVHGGILDCCASLSTTILGEGIEVRNILYTSSSGSDPCFTQYVVRFRGAQTTGGSFTDSWVSEIFAANCWDTGVLVDSCHRLCIANVNVACNSSSTNTIDGLAHAGVRRAVELAHTITNPITASVGNHVVDGVYMESHEGSETATNNVAVAISGFAGQAGFNRNNIVRAVDIPTNIPLGLFMITAPNGVGTVFSNVFHDNRRAYQPDSITIGANVDNTRLWLTGNRGTLSRINNLGTRTYINGITSDAWGAPYPSSTNPVAQANDVGDVTVDTATGRIAYIDVEGTPRLIGGQTTRYGAQQVTALATPGAPVVTPTGGAAGAYDYYVVAIDKDGNKTPPSPVGSTAVGPTVLSATTYNQVRWRPIEGAVAYDLLRGATNLSIALGITSCRFFDAGAATSAYVASATSPRGSETVDYLELVEQATDPAAPVNTRARLFTRDNAGKTELCVRYATGAVKVLDTEP